MIDSLGFMAYQHLLVILFQTIQFSMSTQFVKTFLFQAILFIPAVLIQLIQFSISINFFTHT